MTDTSSHNSVATFPSAAINNNLSDPPPGTSLLWLLSGSAPPQPVTAQEVPFPWFSSGAPAGFKESSSSYSNTSEQRIVSVEEVERGHGLRRDMNASDAGRHFDTLLGKITLTQTGDDSEEQISDAADTETYNDYKHVRRYTVEYLLKFQSLPWSKPVPAALINFEKELKEGQRAMKTSDDPRARFGNNRPTDARWGDRKPGSRDGEAPRSDRDSEPEKGYGRKLERFFGSEEPGSGSNSSTAQPKRPNQTAPARPSLSSRPNDNTSRRFDSRDPRDNRRGFDDDRSRAPSSYDNAPEWLDYTPSKESQTAPETLRASSNNKKPAATQPVTTRKSSSTLLMPAYLKSQLSPTDAKEGEGQSESTNEVSSATTSLEPSPEPLAEVTHLDQPSTTLIETTKQQTTTVQVTVSENNQKEQTTSTTTTTIDVLESTVLGPVFSSSDVTSSISSTSKTPFISKFSVIGTKPSLYDDEEQVHGGLEEDEVSTESRFSRWFASPSPFASDDPSQRHIAGPIIMPIAASSSETSVFPQDKLPSRDIWSSRPAPPPASESSALRPVDVALAAAQTSGRVIVPTTGRASSLIGPNAVPPPPEDSLTAILAAGLTSSSNSHISPSLQRSTDLQFDSPAASVSAFDRMFSPASSSSSADVRPPPVQAAPLASRPVRPQPQQPEPQQPPATTITPTLSPSAVRTTKPTTPTGKPIPAFGGDIPMSVLRNMHQRPRSINKANIVAPSQPTFTPTDNIYTQKIDLDSKPFELEPTPSPAPPLDIRHQLIPFSSGPNEQQSETVLPSPAGSLPSMTAANVNINKPNQSQFNAPQLYYPPSLTFPQQQQQQQQQPYGNPQFQQYPPGFNARPQPQPMLVRNPSYPQPPQPTAVFPPLPNQPPGGIRPVPARAPMGNQFQMGPVFPGAAAPLPPQQQQQQQPNQYVPQQQIPSLDQPNGISPDLQQFYSRLRMDMGGRPNLFSVDPAAWQAQQQYLQQQQQPAANGLDRLFSNPIPMMPAQPRPQRMMSLEEIEKQFRPR